jgi:hypothetical protein
MISYISDLNKEAKKINEITYSHKGKTPLELLCTLLLYWDIIKICIKFARIFTLNSTRQRLTEIINLFDESKDYWIKLK